MFPQTLQISQNFKYRKVFFKDLQFDVVQDKAKHSTLSPIKSFKNVGKTLVFLTYDGS